MKRENDRLHLVRIYMGFSILVKDVQLFHSLLESTDQGLKYYNLCRSCGLARMNQAVITTYKKCPGRSVFLQFFQINNGQDKCEEDFKRVSPYP